jgi:hypothetical protein
MFPRRDPELLSQYLCRFCGERIKWGAILRLIRVDPDTPAFMLSESACHTECLRQVLRPEVELTFQRHWPGRGPLPDDSAQIDGQPCARCGEAIAPRPARPPARPAPQRAPSRRPNSTSNRSRSTSIASPR